jgi:SAM-dependent methyltransferase
MINETILSQLISEEPEDLKKLVRTYVGEALFFEALIARDLANRNGIERIVEVGAGVGLLSLLLARRGYTVTAFEPESAGFSEMRKIRDLVLRSWEGPVPKVHFVDDYLTDIHPAEFIPADIGFAVNVIEHVPEFSRFMETCVQSVAVGKEFRFVCPNYVFPYEPHFNFFTFFTKRATWRMKQSAIRKSQLPDPVGMWNDLSWITPRKLIRVAKTRSMEISFSKTAIRAYIDRPLNDQTFVERKGAIGKVVLLPLSRVLRIMLGLLPTRILPIIDVTVRRKIQARQD